MTYYTLGPDMETCGLAFDHNYDQRNIIYQLKYEEGRVESWPDISWAWEPPESSGISTPPDWTFSVPGGILVSPKVRNILTVNIGPADEIEWLPITLRNPAAQESSYFIPHFPTWHDVLHDEFTHWTARPGSASENPRFWRDDHVPIRWVLDAKKIHDHHVFKIPTLTFGFIGNDVVLQALTDANVTGFTAEPARVNC
jgi:hypothetical protein